MSENDTHWVKEWKDGIAILYCDIRKTNPQTLDLAFHASIVTCKKCISAELQDELISSLQTE